MRVFVTGASGWIGSATTDELLEHGHEVVGLARSDTSARALETKGAAVLRGDLDDLDALRRGAEGADAVVHLANKHDWDDMAESNRAERASVDTLAQVVRGSDRPLLIASGLASVRTETDRSPHEGPDAMRGGAENLALDHAERGVRSIVMRFAPTVHGHRDHGFVAFLTRGAREHGAAAYVADGSSRWPAVHVSDAARLIRLALDQAPAGTRLHVVAETGVPTRDIAEAIGRRAGLSTESIDANEALARFGFVGRFLGLDMEVSSTWTRETFGWEPTGPTLLEDIDAGAYDEA